MKVSWWKFENWVWSYTWWVKLDTNNWTYINSDWNKVELDFTKEEKDMLKSNPEAGKNIVNFYSSLERVWMTKLWNLRNKIFTSVENSFGMQFDRKDWDFLDEREIKIFLNAILVSLWEKPVSKDLNTEAFLTEIELKNWKSFTWTEEQVNNYWDTNLEARFIDKFYPRWDMLWFKQSLFEKAIKNIT